MLLSRFIFAIFFIASCAVPTGAEAQIGTSILADRGASAIVQTDQVRAELVVHAPQGVEPGQPLWLGLHLTHQPHWHTYWKNPGDSGLATQFQWTLPAGLSAGEIVWPTPQKLAIGALANFGFENTALLAVPVTVSPGFASPLLSTIEVKLHASWLVCRQECIPQEGDFVLRFPARSSTVPLAGAFDALKRAQPAAFTGIATATVGADTLTLRLQGLPAAWHGKPLGIFPETPDIIETATAPEKARDSDKGWAGDVWSAPMTLSGQRHTSPKDLPVLIVLENGATRPSVHALARVEGTWPPTAAPVGVSPALQAALDRNAQAGALAPQTAMSGMAWALFAALLGGLILNLMPCVFPVLAIKMLGFAQGHASVSQRRLQGVAYTAGVVLSFMALGGLLLALRAGGEQLGWGFQLQSPAVIAALAVLFTLMGLNLAGQLEFGHVLPSKLAAMQLRHPAADAFLSGMLAVAVASPCTAPFMGASLGIAMTLPAAQALAIFAALGLGLALPYLIASWVPAVAQRIPRPGAWMDTLKRFMAFPMWATVIWLVWVLGHLSGIDGAGSLLIVLLSLALLVWSAALPGRTGRGLAIFSIAVFALLVWSVGPNVLKMETASASNTAAAPGERWQPWGPGQVEAHLAAGKPVFVDFTAAWCITCQVNKKTTLQNEAVLNSFASKGVTLLRADWTRRDPAITQALQALGRSGVPVYVLYAPGRAPVVFSEILQAQDVQAAVAAL